MMSYPYAYTYTYTPLFAIILPILALILVLAGGIALYVLFVRRPNRYHGAAAWLHDFLDFRKSYTERLLRVLYCIAVVGIVVSSIILLFTNFFAALALFVFRLRRRLAETESFHNARRSDAPRSSSINLFRDHPKEALLVMALLVSHVGIVEAGEHERRLSRIEEQLRRRR